MARCFYVVRCGFPRADLLAAWDSWYVGHIDLLLTVPGFLGAQRFFTAAPPDGRPYLALYELSSPDVMRSDEYERVRGFGVWEEHVRDWTRDLVEAADGPELDFATPPAGTLWAAFIRGMGAAGAARSIGLDRSFESAVWRSLGAGQPAPELPDACGEQAAQTVFEPRTEFATPASGRPFGGGPPVDTSSSRR
jgi:hypothetical protein